MASELEKLQAYLDGDADEATVAEVVAKLNDPDSLLSRGLDDAVGRPSEVADTGDWYRYLFPDAPAAAPAPAPAEGNRLWGVRWPYAYTAAGVLAACILVAVGLLIGRGAEVAMVVRVTAIEEAARGPGTVAGVVVENRAGRKAYVAVVGLSADRRPAVHYRENQLFIFLPADGTRRIDNLPAGFDGCPTVLVAVTGAPSGEVVRALLPDPIAPAEADAARERLRAALEEEGFRGATVVVATLMRGGR